MSTQESWDEELDSPVFFRAKWKEAIQALEKALPHVFEKFVRSYVKCRKCGGWDTQNQPYLSDEDVDRLLAINKAERQKGETKQTKGVGANVTKTAIIKFFDWLDRTCYYSCSGRGPCCAVGALFEAGVLQEYRGRVRNVCVDHPMRSRFLVPLVVPEKNYQDLFLHRSDDTNGDSGGWLDAREIALGLQSPLLWTPEDLDPLRSCPSLRQVSNSAPWQQGWRRGWFWLKLPPRYDWFTLVGPATGTNNGFRLSGSSSGLIPLGRKEYKRWWQGIENGSLFPETINRFWATTGDNPDVNGSWRCLQCKCDVGGFQQKRQTDGKPDFTRWLSYSVCTECAGLWCISCSEGRKRSAYDLERNRTRYYNPVSHSSKNIGVPKCGGSPTGEHSWTRIPLFFDHNEEICEYCLRFLPIIEAPKTKVQNKGESYSGDRAPYWWLVRNFGNCCDECMENGRFDKREKQPIRGGTTKEACTLYKEPPTRIHRYECFGWGSMLDWIPLGWIPRERIKSSQDHVLQKVHKSKLIATGHLLLMLVNLNPDSPQFRHVGFVMFAQGADPEDSDMDDDEESSKKGEKSGKDTESQSEEDDTDGQLPSSFYGPTWMKDTKVTFSPQEPLVDFLDRLYTKGIPWVLGQKKEESLKTIERSGKAWAKLAEEGR